MQLRHLVPRENSRLCFISFFYSLHFGGRDAHGLMLLSVHELIHGV